ncbi:hypothetical protein [Runella slithyformis]|uniref:Piwi domain-containing protein n=1 Tax=Runella slithyformis (strain ATCC 29530 / DSM 19594 / LMG 11500 / NCIMB 11436 / LSU 4) TaxID=761193 RepID=A0A7U4E989_RUNSL|nr:hypothetical protein [Runella slithyformis]AEI52168.1 hypothetical protein Runsl_5872 [Runella slithyformis DSM 19594]
MTRYETNIFQIENCKDLTAEYRLFEIWGLTKTNDEYDSHIQYIIKKLSFGLSHPVTVISKEVEGNDRDFLVIRNDEEIAEKISNLGEFNLKRGDCVYFKPTNDIISLSFMDREKNAHDIAGRFLQFCLNDCFNQDFRLWSPGAGKPFFPKKPIKTIGFVDIFHGFIPRVVQTYTGEWGASIDVTRKFISNRPLPRYITRKEFNKLKGKHFIYRYGNTWYEVKFDELSDLNNRQYRYQPTPGSESITVLEDLRNKFSKGNMPPDIAKLPDDITLLIYRNNKGEERRVPAALCYQVLDTNDIGKLHDWSIIDPFYRRKLIRTARHNYFKNLYFGDKELKIAQEPLTEAIGLFKFPDLEFKNNTILSAKGTKNALTVNPFKFGAARKSLLFNSEIGCYENRPFEPQYFLMPESVYSSYGCTIFLEDLKRATLGLHPIEGGWIPKVISYDDRNNTDIHELAIEIMSKVQANIKLGGYCVIMIPKCNGKSREHDELAAICVSKCADMTPTVNVAIIHDTTLKRCIEYKADSGYYIKDREKGLYDGYVNGVALNQVLLNNQRWPFVLAEPLHADLTIGIDVKKNVAGYVFVDKYAKNILPFRRRSKAKERLNKEQVTKALLDNIKIMSENMLIRTIVVHRDGRIFESELAGILHAIELLKGKYLPDDVTLTIVEIPKHSIFSLRLFDVVNDFNIQQTKNDNGQVKNPKIGSWLKISTTEGFICTTGREFRRKGSTHPLYIKKVFGAMDMEQILQDIFYLSVLAFTKPDDCSRNPLTIKMTDRLINDYGEQFDEAKYERAEILKDEML